MAFRTPLRLISLLFLVSSATAGEPSHPSLWDRAAPPLQSALAQVLEDLPPAFMRAVKDKKLGLVVVDVTDWSRPRVAAINGDEMMYAASLPKIAIVLGIFELIEEGDLILDDELRQLLTRTVRNSSNTAATELIRRIGIERLAKILRSDEYRLYDPEHNGGLWVGREYSKTPVWQRDPIHQISHGATPMQAARFYYLIGSGRAFSPELTREIEAIFSNPAIAHKFVKGLADRPDAEIVRKSGTWRQFHADSGVVTRENHEYIIVALAEHEKGGEGLVDLIVAIDDLMARRTEAAARTP